MKEPKCSRCDCYMKRTYDECDMHFDWWWECPECGDMQFNIKKVKKLKKINLSREKNESYINVKGNIKEF
jgi:hypothetical protein